MPHGQLVIYDWESNQSRDAWDNWGVSLADGSVGNLLAPPAAKERVSNESRLERGKRVSTRTPMQYASREVTLEMHLVAPDHETFVTRYRAFFDAITASAEGIILEYQPYGQTLRFRLQYLSCTQFAAYNGTLAKFAVRFIERYPTFGIGSAQTLTINSTNPNEEEND